MTVQSVSLVDKQDTMTKFGYPTSVMSREPTRFLNRDATKVLALNREATKHNGFSGPERVKPIINNRKGDRSEKKWPIRGWEVENCTDDEIVTWMKKQTQLEGKRAAKKKPNVTETETSIPPNNRCPGLEDLDSFMKQSLHSSFLPKEQLSVNKTNPTLKNKNQYQPVKSDNVNDKYKDDNNGKVCVGVGVITPVGFTERFENIKDDKTDRAKDEINQYKEAKASGTEEVGFARERRSRSVPESLNKNNRDKADQRSTAYHKIKRFLKLSKFDDRRLSVKLEDDEDEGYASKTSSAEAKEELEVPQLHRMYSSMIDLSELPSQEIAKANDKKGKQDAESKVKFSYTHQASILHIPETETKLQLQRERPDRVANTTYTRLKREKELRRCSTTLDELPHHVETSMYNIDNIKPMTLVLRKISIQDSEERITAIIPGGKWSSQQTQNVAQSQPNSRASSRAGSRAGSAASQVGPTALKVGSAVSRSSSVLSKTSAQESSSPRVPTRPSSRLSMRGNSFKEDTSKTKEPTWCPKHSHVSLFNRQPTTYSIGDLLPAVDKNIYNKQIAKANDSPRKRTEDKSNNFHDHAKSSHDDGYMLLQKGMDILTGNSEKPTLGPPAFRPNQTRHPLIRSVTVVVEQSDRSFSPIHVGNPAKVRSPPTRVSSDKGPRPNMYEDRDTQKKLKEAFTRFYQNRPKDIGKEFRRMQTMWKA